MRKEDGKQLNCAKCGDVFAVRQEDLEFYKGFKVTPPTLCPVCRQQRRLAFRNERNLYKRICDLCGKPIITVYSPDKKLTVYCKDCWWSDKWDAEKHGMDFNFDKPFLEQFAELLRAVPKLDLTNVLQENSDYTNYCYNGKDCYLLYMSDENEKCCYGAYVWRSEGCFDCLYVIDSKFCYECTDCVGDYECQFCQMCEYCTNCAMCYSCKNCQNCFGCVGLRHKQYHFFNEELSKEVYENRLREVFKQGLNKVAAKVAGLRADFPKRAVFQVNCEDCVGNYLKNSKGLYYCFDGRGAEYVKYSTNLADQVYHWYDIDGCGRVEWCAEGISTGLEGTNHCFASDHLWNGNYSAYYSSYCLGCHDVFGCVGLKRKQFAILNKVYSEDEYLALRERIISHMEKDGTWGEFFPISISPFAYNETAAFEYYPLSEDEILANGWRWKDADMREYLKQNYVLPSRIEEVDDDILQKILTCAACGKNYKIIPQELNYLRKRLLPVPAECPDCRHKKRNTLRMPRKLWKRSCDKCHSEMWSGYAPEDGGMVYCEPCWVGMF